MHRFIEYTGWIAALTAVGFGVYYFMSGDFKAEYFIPAAVLTVVVRMVAVVTSVEKKSEC
ncbi:hypothetical protein [Halobacillus sp. KGW1]|uniref:hypothetical protein n=1 Tax=Halobacillus sp. KGW1 TaxID=1793726 RepID=UPI0007832F7A|nr:hypothetical protein [Halobacillus sp. KGW1]